MSVENVLEKLDDADRAEEEWDEGGGRRAGRWQGGVRPSNCERAVRFAADRGAGAAGLGVRPIPQQAHRSRRPFGQDEAELRRCDVVLGSAAGDPREDDDLPGREAQLLEVQGLAE